MTRVTGTGGDGGGIDLLAGIRVLDLADAAAAYTGRVLADLGADVVLVEPPGGSPAREAIAEFGFTAAGKRSVTIDLSVDEGRALFLALAATSDVLVSTAAVGEMEAWGLGYEQLHRSHPRLVVTSVTPFGCTGPRRRWRGSDLVAWATSGALPSIGDADRAPVAPGSDLGLTTAALNAAMGTMAALTARRRSGTGQLVDISLQESVISVAMEAGPMTVLEGGFVQRRTGNRRAAGPNGHYRARDGAVCVVAYMPDHWQRLAQWIHEETGVDEVVHDTFAGSPIARLHYAALIDTWVEGLTSRFTREELFAEGQRRGITIAPVSSPVEVLDDPHLAATGGWQASTVPAGAGGATRVRVPTPPISIDGAVARAGAVPAIGEHNRVVLMGDLGLEEAEFDALCEAGTI
jgi:crotonobetainyl-CoA:carnitine CoA-transferase CaiB-like acyl-CoA transferase